GRTRRGPRRRLRGTPPPARRTRPRGRTRRRSVGLRRRCATARELDQLSACRFPRCFVARPRGPSVGVAEGAWYELGGELFGRRSVAGGGEIEERVILVAAA